MHVCKAEGGILALAGLLLHLVALLLPLLLLLLYCMVLFLHLLALGWSPQNKEHGQKHHSMKNFPVCCHFFDIVCRY